MFLSRNKKNSVYPCKPQFCYIKVGLKGVKLYRRVFVMIYGSNIVYRTAYIPSSTGFGLNFSVPNFRRHLTSDFLNKLSITKTRLYNFDPLKPHFYVAKLGFTGYTLFFLFLLKNIDCGYSLEPPRRGGSNEYPQSKF